MCLLPHLVLQLIYIDIYIYIYIVGSYKGRRPSVQDTLNMVDVDNRTIRKKDAVYNGP